MLQHLLYCATRVMHVDGGQHRACYVDGWQAIASCKSHAIVGVNMWLHDTLKYNSGIVPRLDQPLFLASLHDSDVVVVVPRGRC